MITNDEAKKIHAARQLLEGIEEYDDREQVRTYITAARVILEGLEKLSFAND